MASYGLLRWAQPGDLQSQPIAPASRSHGGNADAVRVLDLRKNSNQVLATVIWGNVSTNVILHVVQLGVAGVGAAIVITLLGEIVPRPISTTRSA